MGRNVSLRPFSSSRQIALSPLPLLLPHRQARGTLVILQAGDAGCPGLRPRDRADDARDPQALSLTAQGVVSAGRPVEEEVEDHGHGATPQSAARSTATGTS